MGGYPQETIYPAPGSSFFFIKEALPTLIPLAHVSSPGLWPSFVIMDPRLVQKAQPLFMELEELLRDPG